MGASPSGIGFAPLQPRLGPLRLGYVIQGQPGINDDAHRGGGNLDTDSANLLRAPVNDELRRLRP